MTIPTPRFAQNFYLFLGRLASSGGDCAGVSHGAAPERG